MNVEYKFIRNYLTKPQNQYGQLTALFFVGICMLFSYLNWNNIAQLEGLLSANKVNVFTNHEYWRLFTTSLIHGDLKHLLSNSLMLFILMYFVASFYGVFFSLFVSFIMGGVINAFTISLYTDNTTLVGASGILYYLWGFWLVLYVGIETHRSLIGRILRVGAVFFVLLVPTSFDPQTSYVAHYSGFLLGAAIGLIFFFFNKKMFKQSEIWEEKIIEDEEDREDYYLDETLQ